MAYGKVEICGINTAKLKTLRESEKIELLKKVQEGDMKARETLICGNLRLVLSVIQRFVNRGENLDDLFQIGCIGLMKAIDHFDISQDDLCGADDTGRDPPLSARFQYNARKPVLKGHCIPCNAGEGAAYRRKRL